MTQSMATNKQVPDHAILDFFKKQHYLGNAYSLPSNSQTIGSTSETPIALIINPAVPATAFPTGYKALFNYLRTTASDIDSGDGTCFFRYYINPTISTTGTATIAQNLRPSYGNNSISQCYLSGQFTVSSNGTLIRVITAGYSSVNDSNEMIILDPGYSMLITAQPETSDSIIINANSWYEE